MCTRSVFTPLTSSTARAGFSIIEINPNPMCYVYNRDNGRRDFIRLYERLLTQFAL